MSLVLNIYDFLVQSAAKLRIHTANVVQVNFTDNKTEHRINTRCSDRKITAEVASYRLLSCSLR